MIRPEGDTQPSTMSFTCPKCEQGVSDQQQLHRHMMMHMKRELDGAAFGRTAPGTTASTSAVNTDGQSVPFSRSCHSCDHVLTKKDQPSYDKQTHSDDYACRACSIKAKRKDKAKSSRTRQFHHLSCNSCGKQFNQQQSLLNHMRKEHVTNSDTLALVDEIQRAAAKDKSFVCEFCFCGFARKYHLDRHRAASHGRLKPHLCPECGQGFTRKDHMERHLLTHLGLKPFACNQCDKSFRRKETLSVHLATHESDGRPPFPCLCCDRRFASPKSRAAHMLKHVTAGPSIPTQETTDEADE